uniref:Uncharacterized protein n=1 Tax=Arion vulgaris TaxID=1028688 RepID=A0A0B6ZUB6_9EUPU
MKIEMDNHLQGKICSQEMIDHVIGVVVLVPDYGLNFVLAENEVFTSSYLMSG